MTHNVYRDGKVHVMKEMCKPCIFRPKGEALAVRPGRVKEMVDGAAEDIAGSIVCHSSLYELAGEEKNAICRGWYDSKNGDTVAMRLARMHGVIKEVEPDGD